MTTRIGFTQEQEKTAYIVERTAQQGKTWGDEDAAARAKVNGNLSISSFAIEALTEAAGTEEPRRLIASFLKRIAPTVVRSEESGRVLEIVDEDKLREEMGIFIEEVTDRFTGWYKPNSTSNADVEIKLYTHAAYQRLWQVATGKRF